jgi:putative endonuclease
VFYVYVLKSLKDEKLYIGFTRDLRKRLQEHDTGMSQATRYRAPFELIYYEAFKSENDAKRREIKLKLFKRSYAHLKKRIGQSLETQKVGGGKSEHPFAL